MSPTPSRPPTPPGVRQSSLDTWSSSSTGFASTSTRRPLVVSQQWTDALHAIAGSPRTPITVICGPKNSGKSTFSRILLNSLLERYDRVGYLDTDVGQPEFFVPGCLSLHLIEECLPDMMSTSLREPERCFFFGDISSKRDPEAYLSYNFQLYDYFIENFHQPNDYNTHAKFLLPLIINTAGWVKGTGFDVLAELLRYVSPTFVIQIRAPAESKNLPTGAFWLNDMKKESSKLIEISSSLKDSFNRLVVMQKNAQSMRNLQISNYFKQCFPSCLNINTNKELAHALASIPPYQVHFSQVEVRHLHYQVPKHEIFCSLNATIVGLAASSSWPTTSTGCTPLCVGLGIVRGIDSKKGILYVITPVPLYQLKTVDVLFQGFIEIPKSLLQVRGCLSPYMSANVKLPGKDL